MNRRTFLATSATAAAGIAAGAFDGAAPTDAQAQDGSAIALDPTPLFELSPYLFMQFMEPLGATDGSVEAAWDHLRDDWREDVVAITRELGPTMMRWGGIFADFYRGTFGKPSAAYYTREGPDLDFVHHAAVGVGCRVRVSTCSRLPLGC